VPRMVLMRNAAEYTTTHPGSKWPECATDEA
jgi:hypothetical protein